MRIDATLRSVRRACGWWVVYSCVRRACTLVAADGCDKTKRGNFALRSKTRAQNCLLAA